MSEYQYYEFLAVDRPLTTAEQAEVRQLSTRAGITAPSFTNEYQRGDFRGRRRISPAGAVADRADRYAAAGGLPGFVGPVSYRRIVPMKISDIIRLLEQDWWVLKCTTGFTGTLLTRRSTDWLQSPGSQALPDAEDPIQHPEAGRLVKGAAVRGYVVVFEGDNESGYSAYSPDLPGVVAAGATHDETQRLMLEAMAEHLALLRQAGEPVPQPAEAESVMLLDPAAA